MEVPGPQGSAAGATSSTQLSDSSNLARLNQANSFSTGGQIITATDPATIPLKLVGAASQSADLFNIPGYFRISSDGSLHLLRPSDGADVNTISLDAGASMVVQSNQGIRLINPLFLDGRIGSINSIFTAGATGTPAIYAAGSAVAVSAAAAAAIATFTPAADGTFEVSGNVLVTTAGTIAATMTCTYTDEGGTPRTQTMPFSNLAGTALTAIAFANGAVPYEGIPITIRAKGGTAITIQTAGTFTGSVYNARALIKQLQ